MKLSQTWTDVNCIIKNNYIESKAHLASLIRVRDEMLHIPKQYQHDDFIDMLNDMISNAQTNYDIAEKATKKIEIFYKQVGYEHGGMIGIWIPDEEVD